MAAINAPTRQNTINGLVRDCNFAQDPWLKEFGVRINPNMKNVEARVIPAPAIEYASRNGSGPRGPVRMPFLFLRKYIYSIFVLIAGESSPAGWHLGWTKSEVLHSRHD